MAPGEGVTWQEVRAYEKAYAQGFTRYPDGTIDKHYTRTAAKTSFALMLNVEGIVKRYGKERCGFLTLTFADEPDRAEIARRFHSLRTGVIRRRYLGYLAVIERGSIGGRLHMHLILATKFDLEVGVNWEEFREGNYRSAGPALRREWSFLRRTLPKYGFGRHELLPIRSDAETLGKYVGKYLVKHLSNRKAGDKGLRLVRTTQNERVASSRFTWNSEFQEKFRSWATSFALECGRTEAELLRLFGSARPLMRAFLLDHHRDAAWVNVSGVA